MAVNESSILKVIAAALGKASINSGCSYTYLGLDNFQKAQLVATALSSNFDIQLTGKWIQSASNLNKVVLFVQENSPISEEEEKEEEDFFSYFLCRLSTFDNNYDRLVTTNIPSYALSKIGREHKLDSSIKIYYYREEESYRTFVLTENGISYCDTKASCLEQYSWNKIDRVEFSPSDDRFYFYFTGDSNFFKDYSSYILLKTSNNDTCNKFAKMLSDFAKNFENEEEKIMAKMLDLYDNGKLQEAIEIANQLMTILSADELPVLLFRKGRMLVEQVADMEKPDEAALKKAEESLNTALETMDDETLKEYASVVNEFLGIIYNLRGEFYHARNSFILAMESDDRNLKKEAEEFYIEAEENLQETWKDYTRFYDYRDRKFIMPVKDISGCLASDIDVFRVNNLPSCFKFSTGHPIANELYIGHPYNSSVYIPYEGSDNVFFLDKVDELCYLLQCLGAIEISITAIKGKNVNELSNSTVHLDADTNVKMFSGTAEYNTKLESEKDSNSKNMMTLTQKFDPLTLPHLPEDLIWYPEQTNWQRLVQQRLHGNMLEYHQIISTSETKFVSSSEANDVKASAKFLWSKVNASYSNNVDSKFKESLETEWKIDVKFRSMLEFNECSTQKTPNQSALSDADKKYEEEVLFCLEDGGMISLEERAFLERKRTKFGVSEARAKEIENTCLANLLTDAEKEYVEILQEVMVDETISDKVRRLLDREIISLGISKERAEMLERSIRG